MSHMVVLVYCDIDDVVIYAHMPSIFTKILSELSPKRT